jgi:hypothetical protein
MGRFPLTLYEEQLLLCPARQANAYLRAMSLQVRPMSPVTLLKSRWQERIVPRRGRTAVMQTVLRAVAMPD